MLIKNPLLRFALFYLLSVFAFFVLRETGLSGMSLDLSLAQAIVFPFFLAMLFYFSLRVVRIPFMLLLFALTCAAVSLTFAYSYRASKFSGVLLAKLSGDEYEITSRIFREKLNQAFAANSNIQVSRYFRSFEKKSEVGKLLLSDRDVNMLIWGTKGWLMVSFPAEAAFITPDLAGQQRLAMLGVLPALALPSFGLALEPQNETSKFLSALAVGLMPQLARADNLADVEREMSLKEAGQIVSHWRSQAHRGYPWWALGNHYIAEGLRNGVYESASIACALEAYGKARSFVRPADNPELYASISNNIGILNYLRAFYGEEPHGYKFAHKLFSQAISALPHAQRLNLEVPAARIAAKNLRFLEGKPKKMKKKKKHAKKKANKKYRKNRQNRKNRN